MKTLRKQQAFTSTVIKLQFQRQTHNSELDEYLAKISEDDEKIMESNKNMLLTKVYLPLPNNCILKSKDVLDEVEFSCEQQIKPSAGAVGSNVTFFLGENETEELCIMTSGKLIYSLSWTVNDKGIPLAPTFQHAYIFSNRCVPRNITSGKETGIWWHSDIQKLVDWAKDINIDPNDPYYSDLFELIMYAQSQEKSDSKHFRLEQLQEEFNFVTAEDIQNCKRFRLLQFRNLGQLGFYCFQQIPLFDKEIPDTIFQEHGGQLEKDTFMTDMDPISAQRSSSANFVRMMRNQVAKQILTIRHKFNLSDLVSDYEEIISMSQLSNAIFKLSERRRHLKPQRKERRKVAAQAVSDGDVKLLIRILRAYNIPARKAPASKVAVTYSPSYLPNRMSRGRHIPLGNSPYAANLLSEGSVHPFVEVTFQKTVYQTSTADGSHPCWNEELEVDFNSPAHDYTFLGLSKIKDNININIFDEFVIEKHEICGTFQIDMPPVVLGYTWSKTYVSPKEECLGQNLKEYSFLTIFATIEPQLSSAENNLELDTDLISRFVSLIPCIADTVDENNDVDVWMTSEIKDFLTFNSLPDEVTCQLNVFHCIELSVGNKEEHAVLLCNYLLYIGKKAWVLLGTSVLEIWFNIQQNNSPMCTSFDISKEGFWKQLLPYNFQNSKTQTVQKKYFMSQRMEV
ncbi:cc2d2b: putative protein [Crotalus adamanteus]|uniref:C2 domain-containing protein n=1 Tax=Crotalus adamanteus TaxID=8729 RepID=A0AAW1BFW9_CROAD